MLRWGKTCVPPCPRHRTRGHGGAGICAPNEKSGPPLPTLQTHLTCGLSEGCLGSYSRADQTCHPGPASHAALASSSIAAHRRRARGRGFGAARRRARLSDACGAHRRRLSARRADRHLRPPDRAVAVGPLAPAVHRRQPAGRRQHDRDRVRRRGAGGRLHAAAGQHLGGDQQLLLSASQVRHHPRRRAGVRDLDRADRHGGQPGGAGEHGAGVHRLRQGQSGQDPDGLGRQRHDAASQRRAVQADGKGRPAARALSWRGAGAHRSPGRARRRDVRGDADAGRLHQQRQAARAGGDARRAARRCFPIFRPSPKPSGLRGQRVVRHRGVEADAGRDRHAAQRGDQCRPARSGAEQAAERGRRRSAHRQPGGIREALRHRYGKMGERDSRGRRGAAGEQAPARRFIAVAAALHARASARAVR